MTEKPSMWIREEGVRCQFLDGLHSSSRPFLHVQRSGRRVYNNPWPREIVAPSRYFSFVSRAVLWDRGSHHHTVSKNPLKDVIHKEEPRPPCSRFEAHMRACPGLIRPPNFPCTHRLPKSPVKNLRAPKPPRPREMQSKQNSLRQFSVIFPSVPASPYPSMASPDPVLSPTPSVHSGTNPDELLSFHVHSRNSEHTTIKKEDVVSNRDVTLTGPSSPQINFEDYEDLKSEAVGPTTMTPGTTSTPVTPLTPMTPMTPMTPDSLSDLSRPPSSQFSFSTDLNSSLSNAHSVNQSDDSEGDKGDTDDGDDINSDYLEACSSSLSDLCFSSLDGAVLASCSPSTSTQSSLSKNLNFHSQEPQNTSHLESLKESPIIQVEDPLVRETPHPLQLSDTGVEGAPSTSPAYLDSQSRLASASPRDVPSDWKTCRWPILPPITPQKGNQGSRASLSSPVSCSQSGMFDELDAAAPLSVSSQSLDHADCSDTEITSTTTELSPGLAALTVGCDSGDLGSLSRVQLLLMERGASGGLDPSPDLEWNSPIEERGDCEPGIQVWSLGIPQHYQCTDPYVQVSSSMSLSVRQFPLRQVDIRSGTPGISDADDISRSSSWSLSCGLGEDTPCEEQVTAQSRGSDLISDIGLHLSTQPIGKGRELADMMERRKVDILCVQETRWKGKKACSIGAGFKMFYYGVDSKRNGVGVVLKEEFVRNVLEVKRVSDRVMSLKLEIEGVMLNVVSGYAPQVGCELEEKERFWSELDEVMESIPTGERVVIGADFNGHVGEGNTGDEEVMGKFGVKERNLEVQVVVDFAKKMDMAVVNTYFQKREEHRVTYKSGEPRVNEETSQKGACPGKRERPASGVRRGPNQIKDRRRRHHRKMLGEKGEERKSKALQIYTKLQDGNKSSEPSKLRSCSRFEDYQLISSFVLATKLLSLQTFTSDFYVILSPQTFDFLAKYCIISPEKLAAYRRAFEAVDSDGDGYLSCFQVLLALKEIIPPELLTEEEEIYVYRILELVDFNVTEGLTDLRLFAVVASLAQKIATLDDFMRSLISKLDFKSLEMKLYKAKQLFLFLLEGQSEGSEAPQGRISAEQLLVELKAGGIREECEEEVRRELRSLRSLDLLDFLAHLPLFILIHNSVIANPLDDSSNL
ncbi:hypothetical protein QTP86_026774 [Hemibagrus guttatus]|nr:hypothetical protein QTP86_026774 [Hemibagrus guttatus]